MLTTMSEIDLTEITDEWVAEVVEQAVSLAVTAAKAYEMKIDSQGMGMARQGDVLLRRVGNMPPNLRDKEAVKSISGEITLVQSEIGGNTHVIKAREIEYKLVEGQVNLIGYLKLGQTSVLKHQEHGPIVVPAGTYEVRRQAQGSQWQERVSD